MVQRQLPMIFQAELAECGLASLCMVAQFHGHRIDLNSLRHRFALSLKGATLADLISMADSLDLAARPLRAELEHLPDLKVPCILHWDLNHYVVLKSVRRGRAIIHDPAKGVLDMALAEVSDHFTGVVLELDRSASFNSIIENGRIRISDLWTSISGLRRSVALTLLLSILLQTTLMLSPVYLQTVIDSVLPSNDTDLLFVLAVGFVIVQLISAFANSVRSLLVLTVGKSFTMQMIRNILRHLLHLPTSFFEKRFVGDILSRLGSVRPIQEFLTEGLAATLVDGFFAVLSAFILLAYSVKIAGIVFVALTLQIVVAILLFRLRRRAEMEALVARAEEQTHIIESIEAHRTVKLFGREAERLAVWSNFFIRVVNSEMNVGKIEIARKVLHQLISGIALVIVIFTGAHQIIESSLTFGMFFAALLFRNYFSDSAGSLIEAGFRFFLLQVHLDRLGDIVHSEPESYHQSPEVADHPMRGQININRVGFRYAANEPFIFENLTLEFEPGEYVAIIGPSGGGKTTLLKIILGLYLPTSGSVAIDSIPLPTFGVPRWRSKIGVVEQNDDLLAGTISENISFFDPVVDVDRVIECAKDALVHDEIMAMPMNYLSLVGDMGSSLSGGQRQRLLLARALYRRPEVLFLDEGTANLDPDTERSIGKMLRNMTMTRVVIAHRPELVRLADRVFLMRGGVIKQIELSEVHAYFS